MENKEQYDFFLIGQKHALDKIDEIRKMAELYEKHFGTRAKNDFEMGVASAIPQYYSINDPFQKEKIDSPKKGTLDYGLENTRNSSYFGVTGTSLYDISPDKIFNEQKNKSK